MQLGEEELEVHHVQDEHGTRHSQTPGKNASDRMNELPFAPVVLQVSTGDELHQCNDGPRYRHPDAMQQHGCWVLGFGRRSDNAASIRQESDRSDANVAIVIRNGGDTRGKGPTRGEFLIKGYHIGVGTCGLQWPSRLKRHYRVSVRDFRCCVGICGEDVGRVECRGVQVLLN